MGRQFSEDYWGDFVTEYNVFSLPLISNSTENPNE